MIMPNSHGSMILQLCQAHQGLCEVDPSGSKLLGKVDPVSNCPSNTAIIAEQEEVHHPHMGTPHAKPFKDMLSLVWSPKSPNQPTRLPLL